MTTRGHSRKKRKQKGIRWFYITAAGLVSAVIMAAILFKIRTGNMDSRRLSGTDASQETAVTGGRTDDGQKGRADDGQKGGPGDSPNPENRPDHGSLSDKTNADNTDNADIRAIISQMSLEQKAAQLFIITPEALTGLQTVTQAGDATYKALQEYPVGGLIYFPQNLQSPGQLKAMTTKTQELASCLNQLPLFLSIDEEGGKVARIANHEGFELPKVDTMAEIGKTGDTSGAYEAGSVIGGYLEEFGINLDFAPDADVLTNPDNTVVLDRSFGSDPVLVTQMVKAYMKGLEEHHVYGTPKHFPGHGATEGDSHKGFAYTYKTWEELEQAELVPFAALIEDNTPFIMAGHISLPRITGDDTPSSLSPQVLTGYLRETMGYNGIIITDALNMGAIQDNYPPDTAAVMALKAGADLLLMPADFKEAYAGVLDAVKTGELTEERIDQSLARILRVKLTLP